MVRRQGDWLIANVAGEVVMMSRLKVHHIELSEVGERIWQLLEQPQEVDVICERLLREYDVAPEACRAEVDAFLKELAEHGAVTMDPRPSK